MTQEELLSLPNDTWLNEEVFVYGIICEIDNKYITLDNGISILVHCPSAYSINDRFEGYIHDIRKCAGIRGVL